MNSNNQKLSTAQQKEIEKRSSDIKKGISKTVSWKKIKQKLIARFEE